jgi:hypothetical protein
MTRDLRLRFGFPASDAGLRQIPLSAPFETSFLRSGIPSTLSIGSPHFRHIIRGISMKLRSLPLHRFALLSLAATTMALAQERQMSTEQLTTGSDVVVVGKVAGMKSAWTADRSRIVTTVSIAVDEQLKGAAPVSTLSVVVPGGEIDGVGEWYSHSARFRRDEEVVVFARKDKEGTMRVAGGSQGKVSVTRDAEKGQPRVGGQGTLQEYTATVRKAAQAQQAPDGN